MTIKSQFKWFVGLPMVAILFWSIIALLLFGFAPDTSKNPACNIPKNEWSDAVADGCSGGILGYTTAGVLLLDAASVGLFVVGTFVVVVNKGLKLLLTPKKDIK